MSEIETTPVALILTAGTNITITGTYPNQTINSVGGGSGVLASRTTAAVTTGSLAPGATATGTIAMGKSFILIQVVASVVARVELYSTSAYQVSDVGRPAAQQPPAGAPNGVIVDLYLNSAGILTYPLSPVVVGSNQDVSPSTNLYYAITNIGTASTAITVTFTYLNLET